MAALIREKREDWVLVGVGIEKNGNFRFEGFSEGCWDGGAYSGKTRGTSYNRVYCVKWSQDPSFYCCPRDIECDPASGWEPCEEIELFSRRKQEQIDDFYGYF